MIRPAFSNQIFSVFFLLFLHFTLALNASDRKFSTPTTLATEARTLIQILEQVHYNRDNIHSADFAQVIPDYMEDLDAQRLFFLNSDKVSFVEKYGKQAYYNTAFLGNIDAAYEIFSVYEKRAESRVVWILNELKKEVDLTTQTAYGVDRSKANWPSTEADADELWRQRIKFEVLNEVLNKKTPEDAKKVVQKRYERALKNIAELDRENLAETYLSTITRLYDPHSTYFSADTFEDFGIQMKLQLVGIGALLGLEEDYCVVREIIPGGPADLGRQLKPNDKIISVAQTGTEPVEAFGMKLRKIVDQIRGQKGTQVHLVVQPGDATDASVRKEIIITRDVVKLNSARARAAVFQVPAADGKYQPLGVITLPAFYGPADDGDTDGEKTSASKDVSRLITQLKQAGITGLVLDLRHNGGGFLSEAIELTGLFISKGPVVQVKSSEGEIKVDRDTDESVAYGGPLAVLVDRFSASASEIVTGALQNYGRAIVVGDQSTHGKGSVQTVMEMKQINRVLAYSPAKTGAAKVTIQKYYLPSGASTQLKGVIPDIILPSINESLPIGESDLPHALVWDQIPSSKFDGVPLDDKTLAPLRQASLDRQSKLEEFAYLRKDVDRFKARQAPAQKMVSLNLEERKKQKADDDAFRKAMKAEKAVLAKSDFTFKEFRLGPPAPPRIKAAKKLDVKSGDGDDAEESDLEPEAEENDTYVKADIRLRETLRVVNDAIELGQNRQLWANNRPPLSLDPMKKG